MSDISDRSNKYGGGWADCGAVGTQITALQGVNTKVEALVELTATVPNMALSSCSKRPSLRRNISNCGQFAYPEDRAKSAATMPTVSEKDIWGSIPALPDTPENILSVRSGTGCYGGIKEVARNGDGGSYFSIPNPDKYGGGKGGGNKVRTSTEDLIDIFL